MLLSITCQRRPCLSHHIGPDRYLAAQLQIGALVGSYWSFIPGNHPLWLKIICFSLKISVFRQNHTLSPKRALMRYPGRLLGRAGRILVLLWAPWYHFQSLDLYCMDLYRCSSVVSFWELLCRRSEEHCMVLSSSTPGLRLKIIRHWQNEGSWPDRQSRGRLEPGLKETHDEGGTRKF